jgi:sugar lactone lactonase YvrE
MEYEIELIADLKEQLLEGPVHDKANDLLYFVSILDYRVYQYHPAEKQLRSIQFDSPTSCVFLSPQFGIIAATSKGFYKLDFQTGTSKWIFQIDIPSHLRFNDGILDPKGRLLIGTMGYPEVVENAGSLLSYDGGVVKTLVSRTTISNGIAFSKDARLMFYIDTPTRVVKVYVYNLAMGQCTYLRDLVRFDGAGVPDGMDIDDEGKLWVAEWGGYGVSVWNSETGAPAGRIDIPVENVTSVCLDTTGNLYVTTARSYKDGIACGGSLFYVKIKRA